MFARLWSEPTSTRISRRRRFLRSGGALAERYGVSVDRLLIGAGSTELIEATLRVSARATRSCCRGRPGRSSDGGWRHSRRIIDVPLVAGGRSYAYDAEALLAAVTSRTKLLIVCAPNNPTGNTMALEDVRRCAAAADAAAVLDQVPVDELSSESDDTIGDLSRSGRGCEH